MMLKTLNTLEQRKEYFKKPNRSCNKINQSYFKFVINQIENFEKNSLRSDFHAHYEEIEYW